jgi:hypothetical protein
MPAALAPVLPIPQAKLDRHADAVHGTRGRDALDLRHPPMWQAIGLDGID